MIDESIFGQLSVIWSASSESREVPLRDALILNSPNPVAGKRLGTACGKAMLTSSCYCVMNLFSAIPRGSKLA